MQLECYHACNITVNTFRLYNTIVVPCCVAYQCRVYNLINAETVTNNNSLGRIKSLAILKYIIDRVLQKYILFNMFPKMHFFKNMVFANAWFKASYLYDKSLCYLCSRHIDMNVHIVHEFIYIEYWIKAYIWLESDLHILSWCG